MEAATSQSRFHRLILLQGGATLLVFATAIVGALLFFRSEIRVQILQRDGELLTPVSQHFYENRLLQDMELALVDVALESSELSGVIAVRLFSPGGILLSRVPAELYDSVLPEADLQALAPGQSVVRYHEKFYLDELFTDISAILASGSTYPVTEVLTPIVNDNGRLIAVIQYWLDSTEVAQELAGVDRLLMLIGAGILAAGGIVFSIVFLIARQRLLKLGQLLAERNRSLQKANLDLEMAARTSAIGSITSHLFHGLKTPLAGLKSYLKVTGHEEEAVAITHPIQNLIDESLAVIREEEHGGQEQVSLPELRASLAKRLHSGEQPRIRVQATGDCQLPLQKVRLLQLVVSNLVDNALEAAPEGLVTVILKGSSGELQVSVTDEGPGLPDFIQTSLFKPVQSRKTNGTGIGLAISSVIARHIPASLVLEKSDPSGTSFKLNIPL